MSITSEFKELIMHSNVVDLTVGMVVGTTFSDTVKSLVDDVIMPPIGILIGGVDFSNLFITLEDGTPASEADYAFLAAVKAADAVTLNIGPFVNTIISFLIIATAIFVVVRLLSSLKEREAPMEEAPAESSEEVLLLHEICNFLSKK